MEELGRTWSGPKTWEAVSTVTLVRLRTLLQRVSGQLPVRGMNSQGDDVLEESEALIAELTREISTRLPAAAVDPRLEPLS